MAIDGGPKNGDYARYVEDLVNRGRPSPGQVLAKTDAASGTPSPGQVFKPSPKATPQDSGRAKGHAQTAAPAVATPHADTFASPAAATDNTSLAARAVKRRIGVGMTIAGLLAGWAGVRMLITAVHEPVFDAGELIPVAFLLVFAGMLFRGARSLRADSLKPARKLPPLSTSSGRKPDAS